MGDKRSLEESSSSSSSEEEFTGASVNAQNPEFDKEDEEV